VNVGQAGAVKIFEMVCCFVGKKPGTFREFQGAPSIDVRFDDE
jgi:hypothetical protein